MSTPLTLNFELDIQGVCDVWSAKTSNDIGEGTAIEPTVALHEVTDGKKLIFTRQHHSISR